MEIKEYKTKDFCYLAAINSNGDEIGKTCVCMNCPEEDFYKKISGRDKIGKIIYLQVPKSQRNKGIASFLLGETIKRFKNYGLFLDVIPMDNITDKQRLIGFYQSFGFKKSHEKTMFLNA